MEGSYFKQFIYKSTSMHPVLKETDVLFVKPCNADIIRRGDIIIFGQGDDEACTVHRVVGVRNGHFVTRGDNCIMEDPRPVPVNEVIGKVFFVEKGGRRVRAAGGKIGSLTAALRHVIILSRSMIFHILWPAYRRIVKTAPFIWFVRACFRPRRIILNSGQDKEVHFLLGRFFMGKRDLPEGPVTGRPVFKALIEELSRRGHI